MDGECKRGIWGVEKRGRLDFLFWECGLIHCGVLGFVGEGLFVGTCVMVGRLIDGWMDLVFHTSSKVKYLDISFLLAFVPKSRKFIQIHSRSLTSCVFGL